MESGSVACMICGRGTTKTFVLTTLSILKKTFSTEPNNKVDSVPSVYPGRHLQAGVTLPITSHTLVLNSTLRILVMFHLYHQEVSRLVGLCLQRCVGHKSLVHKDPWQTLTRLIISPDFSTSQQITSLWYRQLILTMDIGGRQSIWWPSRNRSKSST